MAKHTPLLTQIRKEDTLGRNILLAGGAISILLGLYHIWGGTPEVMGPVYAADLPPESAGILDVLWYHMAAIVFGGGVAMLVVAYRPAWRPPVAWLVGGQFLIIAALALAFSFIWFGNAFGLPQWIGFGPLALITFWAARR